MRKSTRVLTFGICGLVLTGVAGAQIKQLIKIVGIWEIVKRFGPDIDKGFNKLVKRSESATNTTKVVPIITAGLTNKRNAIGMVQVSGPKAAVAKVKSVAQIEENVLGVKIRALIPTEKDSFSGTPTPIDQVGVTGIVDVKL